MRTVWILLLAGTALLGCTVQDENPEWNPRKNLPSWAYDAPFYYRPTEELKIAETIDPGGIPLYYTRSEYFFIKHPIGYQVSGEPRMALWWSADEGEHWQRAGYYGVEQTHFLFKAETDGPHWIRFIGPGQGVGDNLPGIPHRVYVVDTTPPTIHVHTTPDAYEDKEKKTPRQFHVGDTVVLHWDIQDKNLDETTIQRGTCFPKFPNNLVWSPFPTPATPRGHEQIEIPPQAAATGGIRFRVEATDKAGNVAVAFTEVLRVTGSGDTPVPDPLFTPEQIAAAKLITRPDPRPGWPDVSSLLRGGSEQVLQWLPEKVSEYTQMELQFTSNNGRSWKKVADGFRAGQAIRWTVPETSSKNCRLRVVAIEPSPSADDEPRQLLLVMSQRFRVDTVRPDIIIPDPNQPPPLVPLKE